MNSPQPAIAGGPSITTLQVPFITPHGIEPQDVPWLADLISRQVVRLLDPRLLQELTLSVTSGPNCMLHTARLKLSQDTPGSNNTNGVNGVHATDSALVALKQHHRPSDLIPELHQLLITPTSQYTIPLVGIVQLGDHGVTCLVVPYHPLGNLRRYITDQRPNLTPLQQMQIIHDIASGLEFLHQRGIQHMNLHSANILISLQGVAILTDIGRVNTRAEVGMPPKPTAELERIRSLAVVFMAPEFLASNSYTHRSEVYSLGMVMFELLTGRVAFEATLSQPGLSTRVMFGRQDEIPTGIAGSPGPEYEALIKECWKLNPAERPHLTRLKSRLEHIIKDSRLRSEALKLQLRQQQLYQQQQQAEFEQPYRPGSVVYSDAPTPLWQELAAIDPRHATGTTPGFMTNIVTTTHVIVSDSTRSRADSVQTASDDQEEEKPVEAWTIGSATLASVPQHRDPIPISRRALDVASGQLATKTASPSPSPIQQNSSAYSPSPVMATAGSTGSAPVTPVLNPAWPVPPTSGPSWPTPPTRIHPSRKPSTDTSITASSFPMPPPIYPLVANDSTPKINNVSPATPSPIAASISSATSAGTAPSASPSPIPTPAGIAPSRSTPSHSASSSSVSSTSAAAAQILPIIPLDRSIPISIPPPPSSPGLISPGSLFNLGRSTMIVADEHLESNEQMPSFFNWCNLPMMPIIDSEITRTGSSVASSVKVVEGGYPGADMESSVLGEDRPYKVKSLMVTIEPGSAPIEEPVPPLPSAYANAYNQQSTQPQQQPRKAGSHGQPPPIPPNRPEVPFQRRPPPPQTSPTGSNDKVSSRDSEFIIPAFPEPPATLHNRRISNMEPRYRTVPRSSAGKTPLYIQDRSDSHSSDDSFGISSPKSPSRGSPVTVMAPQELRPGTPTSMGVIGRGTYMPITSAEDVPTGAPSDTIFAAARNGDLPELQAFLNRAMVQVGSSESSSVASSWTGHNPKQTVPRLLSPIAELLDQFEPIERLPVLCCAAVARKNKYQAMSMVLKAGASVECKEHRGGNTPLHLVCETAPPPISEPRVIRYKQDIHGSRIEAESVMELNNGKGSQPSLLDTATRIGDITYGDLDLEETEEAIAVALMRADEQDEQEQAALDRVKEDSESIVSVVVNEEGYQTITTRHGFETLSASSYQIRHRVLKRGGLEDQIRLLALAGVPIDTANQRGETPLLLLLRYHDCPTAVATLLALGADPTIMAPFGPGTNLPEIHVDPMSMLTPKDQKRVSKTMRSMPHILASKPVSTGHLPYSNDPNHILVLHGGALSQAAYYLRLESLKFLLDNEIECSDPAVIQQAVVACKQSVSAQVNSSLVSTQKKILRLLEKDWRGSRGQRRRVLVAERTLNRKMKPPRINVLLIALSVASAIPAVTLTDSESETEEPAAALSFPAPPTAPPPNGPGSNRPYATTALGMPPPPPSQPAVGAIPTMHFFTSKGPRGTEIELVSQHGFTMDSAVQRLQQSVGPSNNGGGRGKGPENMYTEGSLTREIHGWRLAGADPKNPKMTLDGAGGSELLQGNKGLINKFRNINKRP